MTLTPWLAACASIAAPEPESRLTSRRTFAPLVIACSACCCWVDLSPSAFWISASTPASSNAFFRNGRSTVSQRTEDFESGSRTATLPTSPPPLSLEALPPPLLPPLSSSSPQPATMAPHASVAVMSQTAPRFMRSPLRDVLVVWCAGSLLPPPRGRRRRGLPPAPPARRRRPRPPRPRPGGPRGARNPARHRAAGRPRRRD